MTSEDGFTLLETLVVVALIALVAGIGVESLAQRPAQARSAAIAFAALVDEARTRAALSADGASIGVTNDDGTSIATIYAGRPMRGAAVPEVVAQTAPLRTPTTLTLVVGAATLAPPFALFFSPAGHVSALGPYRLGTDAPLAQEPDCPPASEITLGFVDGVHDQRYRLSCEMPRLDLNHPTAAPGAD